MPVGRPAHLQQSLVVHWECHLPLEYTPVEVWKPPRVDHGQEVVRINVPFVPKEPSMTLNITRRTALQFAGTSIVLTSVGVIDRNRVHAQDTGSESDLIVRTAMPRNAEPPIEKLIEHWITPESAFFVRCHGTTPKLDESKVRLEIDGLIQKPTVYSVQELGQQFKATSVTATMTCAGNRRLEFNKTRKVGGVQWDGGAIGNAEWGGIRLSDLLRAVQLKPEAKHVWFEGLDQVMEKEETIPFGGSIPLEKAMGDTAAVPGCLLATTMNGKPLTADHGFPLRAVVPGFIGARSVKWLSKIIVSDRPSPNHFLAHAYKVIAEDTPAAADAAGPIYEFALNSMICSPSAGAPIKGNQLTVKGVALPSGQGKGQLKQVEVSADVGKTWQKAKITSPIRDFCWVHWAIDVPVTADTKSLLVRAVDSQDQTQPRETPWNVKGYQYNGWHQIDLKKVS
jgi:sulfite oxidase